MLFILISSTLTTALLLLSAAATIAAETLRLYNRYQITLGTAFFAACKEV